MQSIGTIYKQIDADRIVLYAWFSAMHTRVDIVLYGSEKETLQKVVQFSYDRICQLERIASYFDSRSELFLLNQNASSKPVAVSRDLYRMLCLCQQYNKDTYGCFDVTIHSDNYTSDTINGLHLDEEKLTAYYSYPGMKIDLSGFIKGVAVEDIRSVLNDNSILDALVNMGNSSVLAIGNHPYGEGWKVGIDLPGLSINKKEILLINQCLTISGNSDENRKHIISPHTQKTVEGACAVAVVTNDAITGEALSTALFVASPEKRIEILRNLPATVY